MLHIAHSIERRRGERAFPNTARARLRLFALSALGFSIGLALAVSQPTRAQDSPAPRSTESKLTTNDATTVSESATNTGQNVGQNAGKTETTAFDTAKEAAAVLDAMDAGDFAAVHARFDAAMSAAITAEQVKQVWTTLPNQVGAAQGRGDAVIETRDGVRIARIPLRYERAEVIAIVGFAEDGKIAGFGIRPAPSPESGTNPAQGAAPPAAYAAPPLPANAAFTERDVVVGDAATGLGGTLALPNGKGPFAAIVLVHGSGPQDRDETIGPNRPFLDIARGLAGRGVAVLRYDKRTKARPQDFADGDIDVDRETTDDALLAVAMLRKEAKIDSKRIFVLGHSQGGMMAPRMAARDPSIAGLVLLAAPSRPLLDILIEQTRRMAVLDDGKTSAEESAAIADISRRVAAVRRSDEVAPQDTPGGLPVAYWRSFEAVDPVAEARPLTQPMLILQGGTDIQVVDADWQGWKGAFHSTPRVTFKLYETLNHLAMPGTGTIAEYQTPGQVDPTLIADVAAWVKQVRGEQVPAGQPRPRKKK